MPPLPVLRTASALIGVVGALVVAQPAVAASPPGPPVAYVNNKTCVSAGSPGTSVANGVSWAQQQLQFTAAWKFTRGSGVKVAVIDTGVTPSVSAFGDRLSGIADLVESDDNIGPLGLDDCDGHGTLVAGIIGASVDPISGFSGVAPEVSLMSIRQSSEYFAPATDTGSTSGAGTSESLAAAISWAVTNGAQIINISEAHCDTAGVADNATLTAAVNAALAANVVIVAAAGNLSSSGVCSKQNTPGQPPITAATPADLPGVLAVAAIDETGAPASFSLAGSWVGVAAPGANIVSTNPYRGGTGQVDQITTSSGTGSIQGTSFAAPYVSGVAALVRARFPQLTAAQVIHRIEATASHPAATGGRDDYVGYGVVDPVAAVTAVLPEEVGASVTPAPRTASLAASPVVALSHHPRNVALIGSGSVLLLLAVVVVFTTTRRMRVQRT